jgi:hypothetical protein
MAINELSQTSTVVYSPTSKVVTPRIQEIEAAHVYKCVGSGQVIKFIKRRNGELVNTGTTNEALLEMLITRTERLDALFPCKENKTALVGMKAALAAFDSRTAHRVSQGVETQDKPHVS